MKVPRLMVAAALAAFCSFAGKPGLHAAASTPAAANPLSLAGEWRFAMDAKDAGYNEKWFAKDLTPDHIKLPGILQGQGYGDDISVDTPWVLTLGGDWWKLQPAALRAHFSQPGHVEVPFLAQPPKHYLGVAWYQRDIEVPQNWADKRVVLFLERAHWQTTAWVDDRQYAYNDSLVAPHVTDLGVLAPGRHRLSIRVDNRTMLPSQGHILDAHSISDQLGAAWNGIVGRIELSATTPVWIDDAQVFPNVAKKTALIKIKIGNATGQAGSGTLASGATSQPVTWDANGGEAQLEVSLGDKAQTWDEFHPNLQHLSVALKGGVADDRRELNFGLREISHNDKDLLLNGRLINVRSTHSGGDFPLTGYPAMDVASWKKIFQVCQDYGLNGMRFHSWCPPEAAFAAGDELGFYLVPECGMWHPLSPGTPIAALLEKETARIIANYGNHPSFILLSASNEPSGNYEQLLPQWCKDWYAKDPRHFYAAGTGWNRAGQVNGPQYAALVRAPVGASGGELRNTSGWFGKDYRSALESVHIPVLAHEVGQWCAYPDFDVIKEFTGYLRPSNYDIFKYIAEQQGVLADDKDFAWASGRFQVQCYKEEIEANLRTPGLAGIQLLDLHDYLGQGTALIGVVDAFWKPKSYVTAAEFRRFAGPTVPLARLAQRVFTSNQTLDTDVEIYHFGEKPLTGAMAYWKIVDAAGKAVAQGTWPARDVPIGKNTSLGKVSQSLASLAAPGAYKLVVGLAGTKVENDWNFWLYPSQIDNTVPAGVFATHSWSEAEQRLAAGGKVLFMPGAGDLDSAKCPPMKNVPVFWNIQMTVRGANATPKFDAMLGLVCDTKHAALAEFPTEKNCDWQWTALVNNVRSVNLDSAPRTLRPIVAAIDDWNRDWRLGVIFECKVGPGRLLVSAINLNGASVSAGAQQLRRSLLDYMAGNKFQPVVVLTSEQVRGLWAGGGAPAAPVAPRAFDPDLNDGTLTPPPAARGQ